MGPKVDRFRAVALALIAMAFLAGCAAPGKVAKPDQPEPPFSMHLPVLETTDMDVRSQPPVVQPELVPPRPYPDDVEEGKSRSLNLLEIHHGGGKPSRPSVSAPQEAPEKP